MNIQGAWEPFNPSPLTDLVWQEVQSLLWLNARQFPAEKLRHCCPVGAVGGSTALFAGPALLQNHLQANASGIQMLMRNVGIVVLAIFGSLAEDICCMAVNCTGYSKA